MTRRARAFLVLAVLATRVHGVMAQTPIEHPTNDVHLRDQPIYVGEHDRNTSQGLRDNVLLLLLTAALTGFLVPYLLKRIDDRRAREQKEIDDQKLVKQKKFEAQLERQTKVIEAQVQLLENLARHLWEYQLLAIAVSYYFVCQDKSLYQKSLKRYDGSVADTLVKIRTEISKSIRLAPDQTYLELKTLYYSQVLPLDERLRGLIEANAAGHTDDREWRQFNRFAVLELSQIVDNTLNNLATALELKETGAPI